MASDTIKSEWGMLRLGAVAKRSARTVAVVVSLMIKTNDDVSREESGTMTGDRKHFCNP